MAAVVALVLGCSRLLPEQNVVERDLDRDRIEARTGIILPTSATAIRGEWNENLPHGTTWLRFEVPAERVDDILGSVGPLRSLSPGPLPARLGAREYGRPAWFTPNKAGASLVGTCRVTSRCAVLIDTTNPRAYLVFMRVGW
ncbi:MAG: hypothetical protein IT370_23855 [Deltaproteobacteria bacterium]|nr:hypothetical protein [Deltaproteobacteria bacterium]